MTDTFITKIHIDKVRHLENLDIPLSETERKHLILTGKNGSGKTSVLEAIRDWIDINKKEATEPVTFGPAWSPSVQVYRPSVMQIEYNTQSIGINTFYFPSNHKLKVEVPKSIEKVVPQSSKDLIKYMVFKDYLGLNAGRSGNTTEETEIKQWFLDFENQLRTIYEDQNLKLEPVPKDLNYKIILPGRDAVDFNQLPDGYSSLLDIVTEIIMYMARTKGASFDMPGICLVDEVETHLHVSLQKKVLPFLTTMFPNIQFIVTTHSPFVITSLNDAVIYDLEKQHPFENLSSYSYEGIVEYYYNADLYSETIKSDFSEYKTLAGKQNRSEEENIRLVELITYLGNIPSAAAPELVCAFREIERNRRNGNGKN